MKNVSIILLALVFRAALASGQPNARTSGLYRSAADLRLHRLVLAGNCRTAKYRLRLNELLSRPYVTVTRLGQDRCILKDSLFGFRDCAGRDYRFVNNNQHYPILNPGEELLLYPVEQAPVGKTPGLVRLFFSVTAAAPIQPLTVLNLKRAFPTNYRLHDLLDAQIHSQRDLMAFDDFHGMTKLNWLLQRSRMPLNAQ